MRLPKVYGRGRIDACPWCGERGTSLNVQGVPCCAKHKDAVLPDMKCACGSWLDLRDGKYGKFWLCMQCGPISLRKVLELNPLGIAPEGRHGKSREKVISWKDL